jgi:hypothetical protein
MKHIFRILYHCLCVPVWYVVLVVAWLLDRLMMLVWHFGWKKGSGLRNLFVDELPDGTHVYSVIDNGSWLCTYTGLIAHRKYRYYITWLDAIRGKVTEKTFDIEIKER